MAEVSTALPELAVAELPAPLTLHRPDVAWSRPGLTMAASGEAERREGASLHAVLQAVAHGPALPDAPGPWFGAAAFDLPPGAAWAGFPALSFRLPALISWTAKGRHFAAAFGPGAKQRLGEAQKPQLASLSRPPSVRFLAQPGERERWAALVRRALVEIHAGRLQKVVLARAVDLESDELLDPHDLLRSLASRHPTCRAFLLRSGDAAFIGATPELLCSIEGDRVQTEALAGSAPPGQDARLLHSGKDLREHEQVVTHIVSRLRPLSRSLHVPEGPEVVALPNVLHLHTPIEARLAPGRTAADVAAALHPTPAVCGAPQAAALRFLAEHEGLDRGLYTGVIGWAGPGRAELAVALRCAIIRGRRARLFVGAGIVEGSEASAEWAETELKARALLGALGASP
jgi:salicylate biosynthesis isochorismate synthase